MEIKFIWIKDYRNIKNIGFNFKHSDSIEFEYINEELVLHNITSLPTGFFKQNISNVTAIVGKNGSGKTNLSEFLNYNLAHVTNGGMSIYDLESEGILILGMSILVQEDVKISNLSQLKDYGYEILYYKDSPLDKEGGRTWQNMSKNSYIYYSPNFEFRYINIRQNLLNISTSYLANHDVYNDFKSYNEANTKSPFNQQFTDSLYAHYKAEQIREADFILNFKIDKYLNETPKSLIVSVDHTKRNIQLREPYFTENYEAPELPKLWREIWDIENNLWINSYSKLSEFKEGRTDGDEHFSYYKIPPADRKKFFEQLYFINLFRVLLKNNKHSFPLNYFNNFFNDDIISGSLEINHKIEELKNLLQLILEKCSWRDGIVKISDSDIGYGYGDENLFRLINGFVLHVADSYTKILFNKFLILTKELTGGILFIHYEFRQHYSSGQQNLLSFFSRFYWAKNEISTNEIDINDVIKEQIIIFIDEGEITLHPEWQRQFFSKTIDFLSDLFSDRKIQLILSTHSPFVLSDIPKSNVIFLDRNAQGEAELSVVERENTFGANIYTLLSDSFFMSHTIGEFAQNKIKGILSQLAKLSFESNSQIIQEIEYVINIIGEPIIKEKLQMILEEKVGNYEAIELRKRIIDLERQIKNMGG